jgi:hypothetical protein
MLFTTVMCSVPEVELWVYVCIVVIILSRFARNLTKDELFRNSFILLATLTNIINSGGVKRTLHFVVRGKAKT